MPGSYTLISSSYSATNYFYTRYVNRVDLAGNYVYSPKLNCQMCGHFCSFGDDHGMCSKSLKGHRVISPCELFIQAGQGFSKEENFSIEA